MMDRSHDANTVLLELVDLEFQHSWSRKDLAPYLGKNSLFIIVATLGCYCLSTY